MPIFGKGRTLALLLTFAVAAVLCVCDRDAVAGAQTVRLPVTIDYNLLDELIVRNAYTETNQSVTLLNVGNGCLYIALSHPRVSESGGLLRFETEITVHAGTPVVDRCLVPVTWKGYLVLFQHPVINGATWKLSFATEGSQLLEVNKRPAKIASVLWDLIKEKVFGLFK